MRKTGGQVELDLYKLINNSELKTFVHGDLYYEGERPHDSKKEDIIIGFKTGRDGQFQKGALTVRIYVPDIDSDNSGVLSQDKRRTTEIEMKANEVIPSFLSGEYLFKLGGMITTLKEPDIKQHFVYIDLEFTRNSLLKI